MRSFMNVVTTVLTLPRNCVLLTQYYAHIGGRDKALESPAYVEPENCSFGRDGSTPRKLGRQSRRRKASLPLSAVPTAWSPPAGSWEDEIASIDSCEFADGGVLVVSVTWKNGRRTKHGTTLIYKKCPQKVLGGL